MHFGSLNKNSNIPSGGTVGNYSGRLRFEILPGVSSFSLPDLDVFYDTFIIKSEFTHPVGIKVDIAGNTVFEETYNVTPLEPASMQFGIYAGIANVGSNSIQFEARSTQYCILYVYFKNLS